MPPVPSGTAQRPALLAAGYHDPVAAKGSTQPIAAALASSRKYVLVAYQGSHGLPLDRTRSSSTGSHRVHQTDVVPGSSQENGGRASAIRPAEHPEPAGPDTAPLTRLRRQRQNRMIGAPKPATR